MENYHMLIDGAAKERAPQRVAKYAYELAGLFHHFTVNAAFWVLKKA